jgi:hypothetical protein
MQPLTQNRRGERGVSFLLVVVGIFSILAMAALAVDVATLYAANSDAQKAADAAALAGAKMFVTSSSTSNTGGTYGPADICTSGPGNSTMANVAAQAVAQSNTVAGATAQITALQCTTGAAQNPRIKVTVGRTDLPLFFGRIFGNRIASVSASATAEAYNNSGAAGTTWVQTGSVKPWFVVNCSPGGCAPNHFFQPGTNDLATPVNYLGLQLKLAPYYLAAAGTVPFYITGLSSPPDQPDICPSGLKPSCLGVGGGGYLDQIACANRNRVTCGDALPISDFSVQSTIQGTTDQGVDCLIHAGADGAGNGQDTVNAGPPVTMTNGTNNPNTSIPASSTISQSDSVITVPVFNRTVDPCSGSSCGGGATTETVVGFLQLGVQQVETAGPTTVAGVIDTVVINAVGCDPGAPTPTKIVSGGGVSPIPVRLIQ